MRQYGDHETVDFAVVGTGAGGGPLIAGLAEGGFSVVGFDAGPYFRPLEDFASDEREQGKLYWNDERIVDGANPITMGGKNSGKAVGGSTVHFAMVSLRFRPEWFKARTALGTHENKMKRTEAIALISVESRMAAAIIAAPMSVGMVVPAVTLAATHRVLQQ